MTATLWILCGAGRKVGKTHLARRLHGVLPNCLYIKCGGGQKRPGRWGHFVRRPVELDAFVAAHRRACEHLLIEHNTSALACTADVVVYLAGLPEGGHVRRDAEALRRAADIVLGAEPARKRWGRCVARHVAGKERQKQVLEALLDQHAYLGRDDLQVQTKLWLTAAGRHALGAGLVGVLEGVDRFGTLRAAAAAAGMSYRHAWDLLGRAERRLDVRLIARSAGGRGGGHSHLTDEGRHMLEVYLTLRRDVARYAARRLDDLHTKDGENG